MTTPKKKTKSSKKKTKSSKKKTKATVGNFLDKHTDATDEIRDKKQIVVKHRKIKRAQRTFLYNIDDWLTSDEIKTIAKEIKKKLACPSQVITDDEGTALTFNGDHTQTIRALIVKHSKGKVTEKSFSR